jgi:hypothetical protein
MKKLIKMITQKFRIELKNTIEILVLGILIA